MVAAGAIEQVRRAEAAGASATARVALGFEDLLRGDVDAMKQRTRRYARRQLTWMRKLPDVELHHLTGRSPEEVAAVMDSRAPMSQTEFEKWQALGNDYLIFEERSLPFALTPARIERICDVHSGVGSDGILLLSEPDEPGFVARLLDLQPKRLGVRPVGQRRARGGHVPAPQRVDRQRRLLDPDRRGGDPPHITGPDTCTLDMGRARIASQDFPSGDADGAAELEAGGRTWRFQHVQVGNPQCAIHVADAAAVDALDLPAIGRAIIEGAELFPNRTNVSWFAELAPGLIRARIYERGPSGRRCPRARAPAARRSPTSCAAASRPSPCASTAASSSSTSPRTCTST